MSLMDQLRAQEAAKKGAAAVEPTAEVKTEMARLLEEEKAITRARAGVVAPPDVPEPKDVALALPAGVEAPGPCPVGGEIRALTTEDAAARLYPCVCGDLVKVKPQQMPDKTYQAKIPEHGGPKAEKKVKSKISETAKEIAKKTGVGNEDVLRAVINDQLEGQKVQVVGVELFLDCREDGLVTHRLEAYADGIARELAESAGVGGLRSADSGALAFGKWRDIFEAEVATNPPPPGAYEVSSSSELGLMAFNKLVSVKLASRVVRR